MTRARYFALLPAALAMGDASPAKAQSLYLPFPEAQAALAAYAKAKVNDINVSFTSAGKLVYLETTVPGKEGGSKYYQITCDTDQIKLYESSRSGALDKKSTEIGHGASFTLKADDDTVFISAGQGLRPHTDPRIKELLVSFRGFCR